MDIVERIKAQLSAAPAVLFMKGTPDFPQCGFSAQAVAALRACGANFAHDSSAQRCTKGVQHRSVLRTGCPSTTAIVRLRAVDWRCFAKLLDIGFPPAIDRIRIFPFAPEPHMEKYRSGECRNQRTGMPSLIEVSGKTA